MKRALFYGVICLLTIAGCNKGSENGNNGSGNDLSGNYIMATQPLCHGVTYVGEKKLAGFNEHVIDATITDTLNSWFLKKQSNGKYMIYCRINILGTGYLIWKEGGAQQGNFGVNNKILLINTSSVPTGDVEPAMQFTIEPDNSGPDQYTIKALSGYLLQAGKGIRMGTENCTRQTLPLLMPAGNYCREVYEGTVGFNYCFSPIITLKKI